MKAFKLISLNIKNFKGIKHFSLDAKGNDLVVRGKNGTGKSTLFDAFTWLLFGRDSMNRTQFEIKTLDENGNVKQSGIDHEVEGVFSINDRSITFKRVYREVWTKKRGTAQSEYKGNTTDYFVDEISVKKKDYDEEVNSIISDETFKVLTNPLYFNEYMDRNKRRKILINMIDNVSNMEVAEKSGSKELPSLIARINGRDIEKYQATIKGKQLEINKELDRIPIRLDEIELSLPDTTGLNKDELNHNMDSINKKIEEKDLEINNIRSGGQLSEYQKQLSNIDMELTKIRNNHDHEENERFYKLRASLQEKESNVKLLESKNKSVKESIDYNNKWHEELKAEINGLRNEWIEVDQEKFEHDGECTCPTCGQGLPEEEIEKAREEAERQFNDKKATKLELIVNGANHKKKQQEEIEEDNEKHKRSIDKREKEIDSYKLDIEKINRDIKKIEENKSDITENKEYNSKLEEKRALDQKIKDMTASTDGAIKDIEEEKNDLYTRKKSIQDDINKLNDSFRSDERIKELEDQEKKLSVEHEELEKELFLTEEFVRSKVEWLEERINSKFKYARFKLFEEQINGGLKEVCETIYDGVPYNGGLNSASRMNIGLDIINTLNSRYGIKVPIFIDNRESVTELIDVESQMISLIVDKNAQKLEIDNSEKVAV